MVGVSLGQLRFKPDYCDEARNGTGYSVLVVLACARSVDASAQLLLARASVVFRVHSHSMTRSR